MTKRTASFLKSSHPPKTEGESKHSCKPFSPTSVGFICSFDHVHSAQELWEGEPASMYEIKSVNQIITPGGRWPPRDEPNGWPVTDVSRWSFPWLLFLCRKTHKSSLDSSLDSTHQLLTKVSYLVPPPIKELEPLRYPVFWLLSPRWVLPGKEASTVWQRDVVALECSGAQQRAGGGRLAMAYKEA